MSKTKLELTWVGKDQRPRLEPRILLADAAKSYHVAAKLTDHDIFDNKLIFGDNLLALKALERDYAGKVKCVFIDPPYNTGSAFTHYDDGLEHSIWLGLMRDRLEIIRNLLSEDGSLWVTLDDNEVHYFKVMGDEIFGRGNFSCTIIWEKRKSRENRRAFSFKHDYILVYAKNKFIFDKTRNPVSLTQDVINRYKNPDNDPRGIWQSVAITAQAGHGTASQFYEIITPSGRKINPPAGNCWRFTLPKLKELIEDNRIYFGMDGNNTPRQKKFLIESEDSGLTPETIWYADDVSTNDLAKRHSNLLFDGSGFDSPKPEELLQRIIHIATNEGDLVLDSFAGSGTTGAVAHKMRRRWIMVELGEHCHTHIIPRLQKVIDGTDQGGVTEATGWTGGGGFQYYKLAPSLMEQDQWGNWIINREYNKEMLCEALCKIEGYRYAPSDTHYWQHGQGSETDFIYVTTQTLSDAQLNALSEAVGEGCSLLIIASAWRCPSLDKYPNLTLKKIPNSIAKACEWGRDDYSLNVENLPMSQPTAQAKTRSNSSGNDSPNKTKAKAKPIDQYMDDMFEGDA